MKHPHVVALEKVYSNLSKGDIGAALAACSEKFSFQIAGKSRLAGKYTSATFERELCARQREFSGGTFQLDVHDILASDQHGTVLATARLTREGKTVELRTVHVWRFEGGKPLAGYEYPRDLYQYDAIWG